MLARLWARGFAPRLVLITAVGAAVQIAYLALARWGVAYYDGPIYSADANLLAEGHGFLSSQAYAFEHVARESAIHPPLALLWLALASLAGFDTLADHQVWSLVPGVAVVLVIGLLGRRVGGERVGVVAAAIAALHPGVWSHPPMVMTETWAQLSVALLLLFAYRWWDTARPVDLAAAGACGALAALARSENVVVLVLLVLVVAMRRPQVARSVRLLAVTGAAVWSAVLLVPWVAYNQLRIGPEVLFASAADVALPGANCDAAYDGWAIGYWEPQCRVVLVTQAPDMTPPPVCGEEASQIGWATGQWDLRCGRIVLWTAGDPNLLDEGRLMAINRELGLRYAGDHLGRAPVVVAYRVARTLSIGDPVALARFESTRERREVWVLVASSLAFYATVALAVGGGRRLRTAGMPVLPLLLPVLGAVLAGALTHGTSRYRASVDVGFIVLAAVHLEAWWRGRSTSQPDAAPAAQPV